MGGTFWPIFALRFDIAELHTKFPFEFFKIRYHANCGTHLAVSKRCAMPLQ